MPTNVLVLNKSWLVTGAGSPEGVQSGPVGSVYLREDGGPGTALYIKESGAGNTGWRAQGNTFQNGIAVQPVVYINGSPAFMQMTDQGSAADTGKWQITTAGQLYLLAALTDAGATLVNALTVGRQGNVTAAGAVTERARSTPMGEWITVPFNAANFGTTGDGIIWTVASAHVTVNHYTLIGKTLLWNVVIQGGAAISGTASPYLVLTLPGGLTGVVAGDGYTPCFAVDGSGTPLTVVAGLWYSNLVLVAKKGGVWVAGGMELNVSLQLQVA